MSTTQTSSDLSVTTTEHPNAARMRAAFAAFSAGDLDTVRTAMTEDATWTSAGSTELAGTYTGWEEISGLFARLMELTDFTFAIELVSVLADDAHAVAIYDATSTVQGRTATLRWVLVDEMTPEGKVRATRLLAYDQAAADTHLNG